jgi:hypothetical protein
MKKQILFLSIAFTLVTAYSANVTEQMKQQKAVLYFIENKGQVVDQNNNPNSAVKYLFNGDGMNIQLRTGGFSYDVFTKTKQPKKPNAHGKIDPPDPKFGDTQIWDTHFHRIDITLVGSNTTCNVLPSEPAPDFLNYYTAGTPEEGVTSVHHYSKVTYENIYPNIDMEFLANENSGAKYNFIVRPGGNISAIRLKIDGATKITLKDGKLLIKTTRGNVEETIPSSYIINEGSNAPVTARFTRLSENLFGFSVDGDIPANAALVIDPVPLRLWATYYGGSAEDRVLDATMLETADKIFICGTTTSATAIATSGVQQSTLAGGTDAFIVRFNASGVRQWGTYYGGSGNEEGYACSYAGTGDVALGGTTYSTSNIASSGAHQTTLGGNKDAFLVKLNGNTGVRIWGTYYGGTWDDYFYDINCDTYDYLALAGRTGSTNNIATSGTCQPAYGGGNEDAFLVCFNSSGSRFWATYYGGTGSDFGYGISCDDNTNYTLAGYTNSTSAIASGGAYQTTLGGGTDAFLAEFNWNTGLRNWGTYYGGSGNEEGFSCYMTTNNVVLAGTTYSASNIATAGAYQTAIGGNKDAFYAKFTIGGARNYATYYGGTSDDYFYGTYKNYFVGRTGSTNAIASTGSYQPTYGGGNEDAFLVKFDDANSRQWGTYYGGSASDFGYGIRFFSSDNEVYMAGYTASTSGISTTGAHQSTFGGGAYDGFLVKFNGCIPADAGTITGPSPVCQGGSGYVYTVPAIANATGYSWTLPTGGTITAGTNTNTITVSFSASAISGNVTVNGTNTCGSGTSSTKSVTVSSLPAAAGTITGPATVCQGGSGYVYSVPTIANATSYTWTLPTGGTITAGTNTNTITVSFSTSATSGNATVCGTNTCGNGTVSSKSVTVSLLPSTAGTITGPAIVCQGGSGYVYSVPVITNATSYTWTLPTGGTITGGNNTNTITVSFSTSATTGNVTACGTNSCGNGTPSSLAVTVNPPPVPTITGPAEVCMNSGYNGYSTESGFSNYAWTVSPGGTIVSGQGTASVLVNWVSSGSQWIAVAYSNGNCAAGNPTQVTVNVTSLPGNAGTISGSSPVCAGEQNVPYSVAPITNATVYIWTFPAGASVISGSGTSSVAVNFSTSAVSGNATVYGNNVCGSGNASPGFSILVDPKPATPVITLVGGTLTSSAATGNQWYVNGAPIPGATWQTYIPAYVGNYTTIVTVNDCQSDPSNSIYIAVVGTGQVLRSYELTVYPNPNDGHFMVSFCNPVTKLYLLELFNNQGVKVYDQQVSAANNSVTIDTGELPAGLYSLIIRYNSKYELRKIVIAKP